MGGDQFSRTSGADPVGHIEQVDRSTTVNQISPVVGKKVEFRNGVAGEVESSHSQTRSSSTLTQPKTELWNTAIRAVERFNDHLDDRKTRFSVRIWAQNNGFRLQLIRDKCGTLMKQTKIIPFESLTSKALDNIINSLLQEHGVVIDLMG